MLECDIWKVFEVFKPVKVFPLYDNAQKSVWDLASPISSVLILNLRSIYIVCVHVNESDSGYAYAFKQYIYIY